MPRLLSHPEELLGRKSHGLPRLPVAFLLIPLLFTGFAYAQPASNPEVMNFRDHPRNFSPRRVGRWDFMVEQSLVQKDNSTATKAANRTGKTLEKILALLPLREYYARCNYGPQSGAELKRYDPSGYQVVEKM